MFKLSRPSPAMVVACLALAISLGGTGYAALKLPRNSVGTKQLQKNAVTAAKIRNDAVTSSKIEDGQVTGADVDEATLAAVPRSDTAFHADVATNSGQLGGVVAADYAKKLWVQVSGGAATSYYGVTNVSRVGTGAYYVVFNRVVRNCAAFATINMDPGSLNGANGTIRAAPLVGAGIETVVGVVTTLPDGQTAADYDFSLMLMC